MKKAGIQTHGDETFSKPTTMKHVRNMWVFIYIWERFYSAHSLNSAKHDYSRTTTRRWNIFASFPRQREQIGMETPRMEC